MTTPTRVFPTREPYSWFFVFMFVFIEDCKEKSEVESETFFSSFSCRLWIPVGLVLIFFGSFQIYIHTYFFLDESFSSCHV